MVLDNIFKYYENKEYNNTFLNLINNADNVKPYSNLYKLNDYLYEVFFEDIDYDYVSKYFLKNYSKTNPINPVTKIGGCTSVRKGNFYGRNLDWNYDEQVTFVIHTPHIKNRYASISVGGYTPKLTKEIMENRTADNIEYKMIPFRSVDGINEKGVFINSNIVPTGDKGRTTGTNKGKKQICMLMLTRFILDHFDNATDAVNYIKNDLDVYSLFYPQQIESHYMIGDSNKTYVVEFQNNQCVVKEYTDYIIMTNFYQNVDNLIVDDRIDYNLCTPYGIGLERWELAADNYDSLTTVNAMKSLMRNTLKYTNSYQIETTPRWNTEFTGKSDEFGDLTVQLSKSDPSAFNNIFIHNRSKYFDRVRDGQTWQTCHTSVYDLSNKKLFVTVQEDTSIEYEFNLNDYLHGTAKINIS